jgi:hypothetical protein
MMFKSFWMGGFECSTHRRRDGRRLDLIGSTGHDRFAAFDFARLRAAGLLTVREGLRWHLCDRGGGRFDFSSVLPQLRAARAAGVQVIWDLCHYGWPDGIDIWKPELVDRFAAWARAVARLLAAETDDPPIYVPINEISFWSWAGGEVGMFNPSTLGRGFELKVQLTRAALAGAAEVRSVDRRARLLFAEPAIHITSATSRPRDIAEAEGHRLAQFQAFDMLAGRLWPQLGGEAGVLDLVGVNYYPRNQWVLHGPTIHRGERAYRPFREILAEVYERYGRPLVVSETGDEGAARAPWLAYVAEEVRAALRAGVPVLGLCLYPICDHAGWDDDRYCPCGLWGYADARGERPADPALARELAYQQTITAGLLRQLGTNLAGDPSPGTDSEETRLGIPLGIF